MDKQTRNAYRMLAGFAFAFLFMGATFANDGTDIRQVQCATSLKLHNFRAIRAMQTKSYNERIQNAARGHTTENVQKIIAERDSYMANLNEREKVQVQDARLADSATGSVCVK
jgi:hypothetical protein